MILKDFEFDFIPNTKNSKILLKKYLGDADSVKIPSSFKIMKQDIAVTHIAEKCFVDSVMRSVLIPDSVVHIADEAFYDCLSLEFVSIGKGLENFSADIFHNCSGIKMVRVSLQNSIYRSIDNIVMQKKNNVLVFYAPNTPDDLFIIPSYIKSVSSGAFTQCNNLKRIILHRGIDFIGTHAFIDCAALSIIEVKGKNTAVEPNIFFNCNQLKEIRCPNCSGLCTWASSQKEPGFPEVKLIPY